MGMFLSLAGIIKRSDADVAACLAKYFAERSEVFEPHPSATDGDDIVVICEEARNTTVLWPWSFPDWDDAASYLSSQLQAAVFSCHIHDGDFWMFVALENGVETAWYNPLPNYWGEVTPEEERKWSGDAVQIGRLANVRAVAIIKYLVSWDAQNDIPEGKAYPNDSHKYGDEWQLVDFMRKIGIAYPMDEAGAVFGNTYRYQTKPEQLPSARVDVSPSELPRNDAAADSTRWWKFW